MTTYFYPPKLYAAEREIAARMQQLLETPCEVIPALTDGLADEQASAVELSCRSRISLLTGRPGSGKTTTSNLMVRSFDKQGLKGLFVAPTGAAAKRADRVVNGLNSAGEGQAALRFPLESKTIHRALEFNSESGEFQVNPSNPLDIDYLMVDEVSMADCPLFADLLAGIDPKRTRLVCIGDPYQLPSVGPGRVLHDLIQSRVIPCTELVKIHRQGANSGIVHNANQILNGESLLRNDPVTQAAFTDFYFVGRDTTEASLKFLVESVVEKLPASRKFDPIKDIQVLSPGKKSEVGTAEINKRLRERLNPRKPGQAEYRSLRTGDRIINRKNNKQLGIVNGDVGIMLEAGQKGCTVDFGKGSGLDGTGIVKFSQEQSYANGESLYLAYGLTIHSSQGSEYPVVLIPVHRAHWKLLFRNLIYTGVTRGKQLTCLVGDISAMNHAIATTVIDGRQTGLQHWLKQGVNPEVLAL